MKKERRAPKTRATWQWVSWEQYVFDKDKNVVGRAKLGSWHPLPSGQVEVRAGEMLEVQGTDGSRKDVVVEYESKDKVLYWRLPESSDYRRLKVVDMDGPEQSPPIN